MHRLPDAGAQILCPQRRRRHIRRRTRGLNAQSRERKHNSRKDVYDNLLVDGPLSTASEDRVSTEQACEEGIVWSFFALIGVAEDEHGGFVDCGVEGEVSGVLFCRFVD